MNWKYERLPGRGIGRSSNNAGQQRTAMVYLFFDGRYTAGLYFKQLMLEWVGGAKNEPRELLNLTWWSWSVRRCRWCWPIFRLPCWECQPAWSVAPRRAWRSVGGRTSSTCRRGTASGICFPSVNVARLINVDEYGNGLVSSQEFFWHLEQFRKTRSKKSRGGK